MRGTLLWGKSWISIAALACLNSFRRMWTLTTRRCGFSLRRRCSRVIRREMKRRWRWKLSLRAIWMLHILSSMIHLNRLQWYCLSAYFVATNMRQITYVLRAWVCFQILHRSRRGAVARAHTSLRAIAHSWITSLNLPSVVLLPATTRYRQLLLRLSRLQLSRPASLLERHRIVCLAAPIKGGLLIYQKQVRMMRTRFQMQWTMVLMMQSMFKLTTESNSWKLGFKL